MVAPGIALIISGTIALLTVRAGTVMRINMEKDFAERTNLGDSITGIISPPIIQAVLSLWLYFAATAIILGFVLFFVKKPAKK